MSGPEIRISNNYNARKTGQDYWLASSLHFPANNARGRAVNYNGLMFDDVIGNLNGVRPSVSLKPGIEYSSGDGSMENPYVVSVS